MFGDDRSACSGVSSPTTWVDPGHGRNFLVRGDQKDSATGGRGRRWDNAASVRRISLACGKGMQLCNVHLAEIYSLVLSVLASVLPSPMFSLPFPSYLHSHPFLPSLSLLPFDHEGEPSNRRMLMLRGALGGISVISSFASLTASLL